jgi:diketogulonate reductase-like aldo/keto reductase
MGLDAMPLHKIETARLLISRLEHLSADSYYAHWASGLRGSLLRYLEHAEATGHSPAIGNFSQPQIEEMLSLGFQILEKAAKEIRSPNSTPHPK